jgi:hypothetical protein
MQTVMCPYHYLNLTALSARMITLGNGNIQLELLALSLNKWVRTQEDYGTPVARHTTAFMQLLRVMPTDLQIRAIAAVYGEDPELLTGTPPEMESASRGREYRSTGASGFTEQGTPDDYDIAAGSVLGYRTWEIRSGKLAGAYGGSWPPGKPGYRHTARCKAHDCQNVPNERNCGCGFWAYWQPGGKNDTQYGHRIVGVIEGSGKVILAEHGFRSQYAVIKGLAPADTSWRQIGTPVSEVLREYHVPVFGNADQLADALGTDPVYSPWARYLSVFTAVPHRELEAYLVLLDNASHIIRYCQGGVAGAFFPHSVGSSHSKLNITQEKELVKQAMMRQAALFRH